MQIASAPEILTRGTNSRILSAVALLPLQDYVLVEALPDPPKSSRLDVITSPNLAQRAKIQAVGPECQTVKPGETVLISRLVGQAVGDQVLVRESTIMAWL